MAIKRKGRGRKKKGASPPPTPNIKYDGGVQQICPIPTRPPDTGAEALARQSAIAEIEWRYKRDGYKRKCRKPLESYHLSDLQSHLENLRNGRFYDFIGVDDPGF